MHSQQKFLSSFNPTCQKHRSCKIDHGEFGLWGACRRQQYENLSSRDDSEIEFPVQHDDDLNKSSPTLWKTGASRSIMYESSPLLPHNHRYSSVSPRSRSQAIAEGRRALMEMINNMPESSYELSLKDIVDDAAQETREDDVSKNSGKQFSSQDQIKKQIKKKTRSFNKSKQISRSGSMEKETFLIRMFIPASLSWKIKGKGGIGTKVSPRPSFDGSENYVDKVLWMKRWLDTREGKNSGRSSSSRSASSSDSSCRSRHGKTDFNPSCWPFFCTKKNRSNRNGECLC